MIREEKDGLTREVDCHDGYKEDIDRETTPKEEGNTYLYISSHVRKIS